MARTAEFRNQFHYNDLSSPRQLAYCLHHDDIQSRKTTHSLVDDDDGAVGIYPQKVALHHNIRFCGCDVCGVEQVLGFSRRAQLSVDGVFERIFEGPHDQHHVRVHRLYETSLSYGLYDLTSSEEELLQLAFDHLT